jgi:hypothetical protein
MGFMRQATGSFPRSRLIASVLLLALAIATAPLNLLAAVIAATAVLVGVAIDETRSGPSSPSEEIATA